MVSVCSSILCLCVLAACSETVAAEVELVPLAEKQSVLEGVTLPASDTTQQESIQWASLLVRVSPQDDIAIATLEQILATPQNERIAVEAAEALLIADVDSALPLSALVNLYDTAEPSAEKDSQRRVAKAPG